jgi:trk system potassium uptake protein
VADDAVASAIQLIPVVFMIYVGSSIVLAISGCDLETSISAPAATMFGVGPGWGAIGPVGNFADVPSAGKLVLLVCMFAGRLEFFTVMILFTSAFWRR